MDLKFQNEPGWLALDQWNRCGGNLDRFFCRGFLVLLDLKLQTQLLHECGEGPMELDLLEDPIQVR